MQKTANMHTQQRGCVYYLASAICKRKFYFLIRTFAGLHKCALVFELYILMLSSIFSRVFYSRNTILTEGLALVPYIKF